MAKWMRQPIQPIASLSHALEVKSRKDGQMHPNCNRLAFARMMVASDMHGFQTVTGGSLPGLWSRQICTDMHLQPPPAAGRACSAPVEWRGGTELTAGGARSRLGWCRPRSLRRRLYIAVHRPRSPVS